MKILCLPSDGATPCAQCGSITIDKLIELLNSTSNYTIENSGGNNAKLTFENLEEQYLCHYWLHHLIPVNFEKRREAAKLLEEKLQIRVYFEMTLSLPYIRNGRLGNDYRNN